MVGIKRLMFILSIVGLVGAPALADVALLPGTAVTNPLTGAGTFYSTVLPGWAGGAAIATLNAPVRCGGGAFCAQWVWCSG